MHAAVVTVGDELLTGDTNDTNATWLCEQLTARGVTVERVTTVPDRVGDIAAVVGRYADTYDAVVVTGGLGPTHDDVTMDGVAAAFDREVIDNEAAREWLTEEGGYASADLAPGTVALPAGARFLPNDAGVAPGAVVESVYVLPGVPDEMRAMFDRVAEEFAGDPDHVAVVETGEPESELIDRLRAVQETFDVAVGSYPGETVRLKVRAPDPETAAAAADWLRERVEIIEE
jgi:molybdenum cofactor synthesis domain-containing protein